MYWQISEMWRDDARLKWTSFDLMLSISDDCSLMCTLRWLVSLCSSEKIDVARTSRRLELPRRAANVNVAHTLAVADRCHHHRYLAIVRGWTCLRTTSTDHPVTSSLPAARWTVLSIWFANQWHWHIVIPRVPWFDIPLQVQRQRWMSHSCC